MVATASKIRDEWLKKARVRVDDLHRLQEAGLICKDGDFVPSVHYPPITMYPPISEDTLFDGYSMPEDGLLDVYAHIPFCAKHCVFCHYPVKLGEQKDEKDRYLDALEKEMDLYMGRLGVSQINARSILVGGGTPTYLSLPQMERFLKFFTSKVNLSQCKQFNYDVDPVTLIGDVGKQRLKMLREYGVDRVTIGVQSLNDEVLRVMGRHHNSQAALDAIEECRKIGMQINIEFIFGHPGQTLENWVDCIEKAVKLDVDEIQLYRLKVQSYGDFNGPIMRLRVVKPWAIPTLEDTIMMKQLAIDCLNENGFHENLRRVYTKKPEHYSHYAHNQCCLLLDQVGFGLTAFSSLRNRFALNTQHFDEYYNKINSGQLPMNRGYVRNRDDQVRWAIILPLKNREVRKRYYEKCTGGVPLNNVFKKKFDLLKQHGLIEETDRWFILSTLGKFFADEVCESFNGNEYKPFAREQYAEGPLNPYADNEPFVDEPQLVGQA